MATPTAIPAIVLELRLEEEGGGVVVDEEAAIDALEMDG